MNTSMNTPIPVISPFSESRKATFNLNNKAINLNKTQTCDKDSMSGKAKYLTTMQKRETASFGSYAKPPILEIQKPSLQNRVPTHERAPTPQA